MKKIVMIGIAISCLLAGPAVFAGEPSNGAQGAAGMHQEHKAMEKKAMKKMVHHRFTAEQVKAIQEALNTHGAKLKTDGKWGKETREAIKAYQKDNGLRTTGHANKKTRAKLGLTF